ncbi:hypothetical protein ABW22_15735 [Thiobacillus denitrificans]|uniref:Uncharacterized protein n=1 Tax=Thiobacillus denitrificans TaxID=36861 RepID=A0A119CTN2_THIDE|nr:hypothetical protein [Thiobacillus denitrificans]KVW92629.1 hypothetical protein ABW22_15735 [Thiobacillus denitrificans]
MSRGALAAAIILAAGAFALLAEPAKIEVWTAVGFRAPISGNGCAWRQRVGCFAFARHAAQYGPLNIGSHPLTWDTRDLFNARAEIGRRHVVWVFAIQPAPHIGLRHFSALSEFRKVFGQLARQ